LLLAVAIGTACAAALVLLLEKFIPIHQTNCNKPIHYFHSIKGNYMPAKHIPTQNTRLTVENSCGEGMPHESIGVLIGIDDKTLRKHYRHELDMGKARANSQIAQTLFNKTVGGDTTCLIWWTKSQMKWSAATAATAATASTASQIENVRGANIDLRALTDDQLEKIATGSHY
jgi:hypothetical protein